MSAMTQDPRAAAKSAPAASPAAAPPGGAGFERARWIEGRVRELPQYVMFFYNLLLDSRLSKDMKEHAFGTLRYIFDAHEIIEDDDPVLGRLDDLALSLRCFAELIGRLPAGTLAVYEEVLAREGVAIREHTPLAYNYLGNFFLKIASIYKDTIVRYAPELGNAIKTGALVKDLHGFFALPKQEPWTPDRLQLVENFLSAVK